MADETAGRRGRATIIALLVGLGAAGVATVIYTGFAPDGPGTARVDVNGETIAADSDPAASEPQIRQDAASPKNAPPGDPDQLVPTFDVVRVDPDGTTVIAGTAQPGARVTILMDETAQQTVDVDSSGQFVALLDLPPGEAARALTLESALEGRSAMSRDQIILAPSPPVDARAEGGPATSDAESPQNDTADADPSAVTVLRAGEDGIEMVQPTTSGKAGIPDRITLDTISYDDEGGVSLGGRAKADSTVRVYLDNTRLTDFQADESGRWTATLRDIAPGRYTLRLDEISGTGAVLSRMETPFQRESHEALASSGPDADAAPVRAVTVQQGDTLWAISRDRFGEGMLYLRVFEANRDAIRDPDLIYPGQVFAIPE